MDRLPEQQVADAFHVFLKMSLSQARTENLLDDETLESAEADIMISGPALCLFFAALRANTTPPAVIIPNDASGSPMILSSQTCPPSFINFFALWSSSVPGIQALNPTQQHDLARAICAQPPVSTDPHPATQRIAADLRAVAIEISQRRTFQNRYGSDLQAVLDSDASVGRRSSNRTKFVPPPAYDSEGATSHESWEKPLPAPPETHDLSRLHPSSPALTSSISYRSGRSSRAGPSRSRSHSPVILNESDPVIDVIRETLYAALGDVLSLAPSIRLLLATDPARAYFASVSLAILDVSLKAVTPAGDVEGVLGQYVFFDECPDHLKPLMRALNGISRRAREISEEDDQRAMELLSRGRDNELALSVTRMDRLKFMLERGVGSEESEWQHEGVPDGRISPAGTTIELANQINALALRLTQLPAFRERQVDVFRILAGVK